MKIRMEDLVKIIREELTKFVDVDPDELSAHDVINDEEGPASDAWEAGRFDAWSAEEPVQHKRPSIEKQRHRLAKKAGLVKDY